MWQPGPLLLSGLLLRCFLQPPGPPLHLSQLRLPACTSSHTAPHLVGHQPLPFFLGLKIEGENVIPEGQVRRGQS